MSLSENLKIESLKSEISRITEEKNRLENESKQLEKSLRFVSRKLTRIRAMQQVGDNEDIKTLIADIVSFYEQVEMFKIFYVVKKISDEKNIFLDNTQIIFDAQNSWKEYLAEKASHHCVEMNSFLSNIYKVYHSLDDIVW